MIGLFRIPFGTAREGKNNFNVFKVAHNEAHCCFGLERCCDGGEGKRVCVIGAHTEAKKRTTNPMCPVNCFPNRIYFYNRTKTRN